MAKRARQKPIGTSLPPDWRDHANWKVVAMINKIPHTEYELHAERFEAARRNRLSDDWPGEWKLWCRQILVSRHGPQEKLFGSDLFG